MSDSSKMLGFIEFDNSKEIYYLKMDKVIKKLKNFNDIFNAKIKCLFQYQRTKKENLILLSSPKLSFYLFKNRRKTRIKSSYLFFFGIIDSD